MEKVNLRKLSDGELYAVKKQVVRLKQMGKSGAENGFNFHTVGLCRHHVPCLYGSGRLEPPFFVC